MRRESELRRRLRALEILGEAVRAMKSLSAHHFRETRRAVEPARAYRAGIERVLAWTGASIPAGDGPAGLLVVGAELGLCGSYNARLAAAAVTRRRKLGPGPTVCVGHRAAVLLRRQGVEPDRTYGAPTSVRGIPEMLLRLAEDVLASYAKEGLSRFDVVSGRFGGVGDEQPTAVQLLPFGATSSGSGPVRRYVSPDHLAAAAGREILYVVVYDLLLDALACEHGARLLATQSAETWLDERTNGLRRRLAAARREASTQEMIEIAAGARARNTMTRRTGL
jgi:F-type H+-transporting ATPase subunit gamma